MNEPSLATVIAVFTLCIIFTIGLIGTWFAIFWGDEDEFKTAPKPQS